MLVTSLFYLVIILLSCWVWLPYLSIAVSMEEGAEDRRWHIFPYTSVQDGRQEQPQHAWQSCCCPHLPSLWSPYLLLCCLPTSLPCIPLPTSSKTLHHLYHCLSHDAVFHVVNAVVTKKYCKGLFDVDWEFHKLRHADVYKTTCKNTSAIEFTNPTVRWSMATTTVMSTLNYLFCPLFSQTERSHGNHSARIIQKCH